MARKSAVAMPERRAARRAGGLDLHAALGQAVAERGLVDAAVPPSPQPIAIGAASRSRIAVVRGATPES